MTAAFKQAVTENTISEWMEERNRLAIASAWASPRRMISATKANVVLSKYQISSRTISFRSAAQIEGERNH